MPGERDAEDRAWELVRAAYEERTPAKRPTARSPARVGRGRRRGRCSRSGSARRVPRSGDAIEDVFGIGEPDAKPAAALVAGDRRAPGRLRPGRVDRPRGRFQAVARRLRPGELVPAWPLRRGRPGPRARRGRHRGRPPLDLPGTRGGPRPALGGRRRGHADRLPQRRRPARDRRRRQSGDRSADRPRRRSGGAGLAADRLLEAGPAGRQRLRAHLLDRRWRDPQRQRRQRRRRSRPAATIAGGSPSRPAGGAEARALSPDGDRVARLERVGASDRLLVTERGGGGSVLFSARGRLTGPTWSPDGRWLLVGWPAADQWLFIDAAHPRRVVAFDRISEQFDPGGAGPAPFPSVSGWVLPQR